jgi:hypothetical protein
MIIRSGTRGLFEGILIRLKKAAAMMVGAAVISVGLSTPAAALNGLTRVVSCSQCATTADFERAAEAAAMAGPFPGTFLVVSTNVNMTAFIRVTGTLVPVRNPGQPGLQPGAPLALTNVSSFPVDWSGNSLAGQPETTLQSTYSSIDMSLYGVNRAQKIGNVQVPAGYQGSFICNCDLEDMGTQAQNWLVQQYGNSAAVLAPGTIITLKFADESTAQFIKISGATDIMWQWTGTAHDKNGNLINSHGPLAQNNPNTSGSGGGSASASAFGGTAPQVVYGVTGFKSCTVSITAVNPDGSTASLGDYTIPC